MIWDNYDYSWVLKHPTSSVREQLKHIRKPDMSELDEVIGEDPENPLCYGFYIK